MNEHKVTVVFDKDFQENEDARRFVRSCLEGNRASSYAMNVHVTDVENTETQE